MSNIISRVTRGRITAGTTKKVLVLALAGTMYFASDIINPPSVSQGGSSYVHYNSKIYPDNKENLLKEKIIQEDSEIVAIVQLCLKITII